MVFSDKMVKLEASDAPMGMLRWSKRVKRGVSNPVIVRAFRWRRDTIRSSGVTDEPLIEPPSLTVCRRSADSKKSRSRVTTCGQESKQLEGLSDFSSEIL